MQIVVATQSLAGPGGCETYTVTTADHLQRLGHDVWLHALDHGEASAGARALGLRVAAGEDALPAAPDVLLVQDGVVAYELADRYPRVPQVLVAHSDVFDLSLPPNLPGMTAAVVTLYDRVDRRVRALAQEHRVVRLAQPIDVERFKPTGALPARPRVALTLGNYVHGERAELLERACARASIELRHVGAHGEGVAGDTRQALHEAHVVFGKARVVLEAMACGRAVYVLDHNGAEGWVTAANRAALAADNFGGQSAPIALDEDRLVADLARYDAQTGLGNRDFVVAHHAASKHAAALSALLHDVAPRSASVDAPVRELARLVRAYHRADVQTYQLHAELAHRDRQLQEAGEQLRVVHGEAHDAREALDAARRAAAEADERAAAAERRTAELLATRRWRAVQRVLRPADRLRAAMRERTTATTPGPTGAARAPAPFIVGVPRSGTTLLRLLLDANSQLAIPPDTGFGLAVEHLAHRDARPAEVADALTALEPWPDLGIDTATLHALLTAVRPWSVGGGLRAVYASYAARHGKPRWGDKTPVHCLHMEALAAALPEARFVHLIRDGRDVAASLRGLPFAPGDGGVEAAACAWRDQIVQARTAGARLPHYREVRYEQLVASPEATLRELCAYLELPFEPAMLRAHERAAARLEELPEARRSGLGTTTRAERVARHARTSLPPDPARAGRWRADLAVDEVARVEAAAGDVLAQLGYDLAATP